jgi:hypothetical protein
VYGVVQEFSFLWAGSAQSLNIPYVFYAAAFEVKACGVGGEGAPSNRLLVHPQTSYPKTAVPPGLRLETVPCIPMSTMAALMTSLGVRHLASSVAEPTESAR